MDSGTQPALGATSPGGVVSVLDQPVTWPPSRPTQPHQAPPSVLTRQPNSAALDGHQGVLSWGYCE